MVRWVWAVVFLWAAVVVGHSSADFSPPHASVNQASLTQAPAPQPPASKPTTPKPPATEPPAAEPPATQPPALPAGYAGSDTCVLCHTDQEASLKGTQHGRAKNPRSPAAAYGCESCHGPGQAHVDDEAKGNILKFAAMKPADVSQTCLTCHNRGAHAAWEGSTHEAPQPLVRDVPQRPQAGLVRAPAREGDRNRSCAPRAIALQVVKTERAVAHMPVREGKLACSTCHNPHGSISNVKALEGRQLGERELHQLSRGDARTRAVGARARARELHDVPRPARLVERSHAGRPHADAVSALPCRHAASGVDLRQQRHHREQEQPDVRPVVRELPLERPRVEPPVGPVLHAVALEPTMRDCESGTRRRIGVLVGGWLAAPGADAQPRRRRRTASPRRRSNSRRPAPTPIEPRAAPSRAAARGRGAESTRSLFDPTWRQAQISGRWSSVSGDPARFQRYEDLGNGLLLTDVRYAREQDDWLFQVGADNVGWRDQRFFGTYERTGSFVISGLWDEIPQFYSVDTRTPYSPAPGPSPLVLDDAVQRAIQNGQANLNAYVPIATQFDLRERRDIGTVQATATPTKADRRQGGVHDDQALRASCRGAPASASATTSKWRCPTTPAPTTSRVGAEWTNSRGMVRVAYDGSWFNNLDDTLVWDSPLRLDDSTSAPGRGRMALWPSNSAQTISAAAIVKLARRTQVTGFLSYGFWSNDEPLQPFTINPTLPAAGAAAAARPRPRPTSSRRTSTWSRGRATDWRFSARLRRYDYDNQTPHAAIPQFINYDTSVKTSSTGGPEPLRAQPHDVRRRRDLDGAAAVRPHRRLHAQQRRVRFPDLREHRRGRADAEGRRGRVAVGDVPRELRAGRSARVRASMKRC